MVPVRHQLPPKTRLLLVRYRNLQTKRRSCSTSRKAILTMYLSQRCNKLWVECVLRCAKSPTKAPIHFLNDHSTISGRIAVSCHSSRSFKPFWTAERLTIFLDLMRPLYSPLHDQTRIRSYLSRMVSATAWIFYVLLTQEKEIRYWSSVQPTFWPRAFSNLID